MENEKQIQNDNEISLLDLFAVLLRYRKLIIGMTFCAFVLAAAGYFIFPAWQYNNAMKKRQFQGRMLVSIDPRIRGYISRNLDSYFKNAEIILDSLREAGMYEFNYSGGQTISLTDESERARALYIIDRYFVDSGNLNKKNKKFQIITNPSAAARDTATTVVRDNFTVEIIFKDEDRELIMSFFKALFASGNTSIGEHYRPYAEREVHVYEEYMNSPSITQFTRDYLGYGFGDYTYYTGFLNGDFLPLILVGEPIIMDTVQPLSVFRSGFRSKAVIIVFAGFFMAVFLAFVLNAIRNIKNDEEAMKKIHDAMGNSGE
jgi:hypothetical protein